MTASLTFSKRSLIFVTVFMAILLLLFSTAHYFTLETLSNKMEMLAQDDELLPEQRALLDQFRKTREIAGTYYIPAAALLLAVVGLLLWRSLRRPDDFAQHRDRAVEPARADDVMEDTPVMDTPAAGREERLFLHLLSVLQREGRLLDFLAEDLNGYEDAQIGAAVRTIHENCKRAVQKYLELAPVVTVREDADYTVDKDFDAAAIKLTGNVGSRPPFEGVVRHRGWRAAALELPTFSATADAHIIAPAEVEIL